MRRGVTDRDGCGDTVIHCNVVRVCGEWRQHLTGPKAAGSSALSILRVMERLILCLAVDESPSRSLSPSTHRKPEEDTD